MTEKIVVPATIEEQIVQLYDLIKGLRRELDRRPVPAEVLIAEKEEQLRILRSNAESEEFKARRVEAEIARLSAKLKPVHVATNILVTNHA